MCACRCGIRVHLKDGAVRYIEGNPDHPVNRGVLCAKGSAGIMQHYSPARLSRPLLRTGERGSGEFREISWPEAIGLAVEWLRPLRETDPRKLAFFTGRDQSQALTGWWASRFGTPNHAAHGGFCSVNMAAAGLYSIGGSFWEFGEPDWEHTRWFMLLGVAEDHDSNPIKLGLARLKERGRKGWCRSTRYAPDTPRSRTSGSGSPRGRTVSSSSRWPTSCCVRARWTPGYLASYTNAPWLVVEAPGDPRDGLFVRDGEGRPLVWDRVDGVPPPRPGPGEPPRAPGPVRPPGRNGRAARLRAPRPALPRPPVRPDAVARRDRGARRHHPAARGGDGPRRVRGDRHPRRPVDGRVRPPPRDDARAPCRVPRDARHLRPLQRVPDLPGAARGADASRGPWTSREAFATRRRFPARPRPPQRPAGRPDEIEAGKPMPGPPLGFPQGPEDLLVDADGRPTRIDKAFSWEAPIAAHGMLHTVIRNAWAGDPYPIDTLFLYMANMAWNSAMNTSETAAMLADRDPATGEYRIPRFIYSDAFASETVAYADLVLPDTTYLERWDCISILDRPIGSAEGPADSIRQPVRSHRTGTCGRSRTCCSRSERVSGCRASSARTGRRAIPGGIQTFSPTTSTARGSGRSRGWRGPAGDAHRHGRAEPRRPLRRERLLLAGRARPVAAVLQALQPRLPRLREAHGIHRVRGPGVPSALLRAAPAFPALRTGARGGAAARGAPRPGRALLRPPSRVVRALRFRGRPGGGRRRRTGGRREAGRGGARGRCTR